MLSTGMQFFIIKPILVKLCIDLLWFYVPRPIFRAGHYSYVALILKTIVPCAEDRSDHLRLLYNFANTGLIIKSFIPTDSIRVILQCSAMIIT